jgi:hypothetical protein
MGSRGEHLSRACASSMPGDEGQAPTGVARYFLLLHASCSLLLQDLSRKCQQSTATPGPLLVATRLLR